MGEYWRKTVQSGSGDRERWHRSVDQNEVSMKKLMATCDLVNQVNIIKDDRRNTWDMEKQTPKILEAKEWSQDGRNEKSKALTQRKALWSFMTALYFVLLKGNLKRGITYAQTMLLPEDRLLNENLTARTRYRLPLWVLVKEAPETPITVISLHAHVN